MSAHFPHLEPVILCDTREQAPLKVEAYPVERVGLSVGDYGISGFSDWNRPRFIVERKSLNDLAGSLTGGRKRFMREVEGLRRFDFAAILIEGTEDQIRMKQYRASATPQSLLASLLAIQVRAGIHIVWATDSTGAAAWLENAVRLFVRGIEKEFRALASAHVEGVEQEHVEASGASP